MMEITGINIAIGGEGEVDQGSIFLSFQVSVAHLWWFVAKYFVEGCLPFFDSRL